MVRTIINSKPDPEKDFEVVIHVGVAVGAGESHDVSTALKWSVVDRRVDDSLLPRLDRHWQRTANSSEAIEARKYGLSLPVLLDTREALSSIDQWEDEEMLSQRHRDVRRALDIVDRAILLAYKACDGLAPMASKLKLEK